MFPKIVLLGKISSLIKKSEEPFAGRKSHGDCTETLLFKPEPIVHDVDSLLHITFCFSVLKVHSHRFPVLPVTALRCVLNTERLPFLTPIFHRKTQTFGKCRFLKNKRSAGLCQKQLFTCWREVSRHISSGRLIGQNPVWPGSIGLRTAKLFGCFFAC